jgi:hypothetical protein
MCIFSNLLAFIKIDLLWNNFDSVAALQLSFAHIKLIYLLIRTDKRGKQELLFEDIHKQKEYR